VPAELFATCNRSAALRKHTPERCCASGAQDTRASSPAFAPSVFMALDLSGLDAFDTYCSGDSH